MKPRFVLLRGRGIPAQGRYSSVVKDRSPEGFGAGGELGSPRRSPPHAPSITVGKTGVESTRNPLAADVEKPFSSSVYRHFNQIANFFQFAIKRLLGDAHFFPSLPLEDASGKWTVFLRQSADGVVDLPLAALLFPLPIERGEDAFRGTVVPPFGIIAA